jgi:hypothetical protein
MHPFRVFGRNEETPGKPEFSKRGFALLSPFNKIDRIPYFDTCPQEGSISIIRFFGVSFFNLTGRFSDQRLG